MQVENLANWKRTSIFEFNSRLEGANMPRLKPLTSAEADLAKHLGNALKTVRETSGKTRADAARAIGVSPQQLRKYEIGSNYINIVRLKYLAEFIGVSLVDLILGLEQNNNVICRSSALIFDDKNATDSSRLCREIGNQIIEIETSSGKIIWFQAVLDLDVIVRMLRIL